MALCAAASTGHPQAQTAAQGIDAPRESKPASIAAAFMDEVRKGTSLSYTQVYRSGGKTVRLSGSIYAAVTGWHIDACHLDVETTLTDHFAGSRGRKTIPDTWNHYESAVDIPLGDTDAMSFRVVRALPEQLESHSHPNCGSAADCKLAWIEVRTVRPAIRVRVTTNDVVGYDGSIREPESVIQKIRMPVSSAEAGGKMGTLLRDLSENCAKNGSPRATPGAAP